MERAFWDALREGLEAQPWQWQRLAALIRVSLQVPNTLQERLLRALLLYCVAQNDGSSFNPSGGLRVSTSTQEHHTT